MQGLHGQKSIWHAHDLSWHTPRHAMGSPWLAMAHTKACHGSPWLAMAHTKAAHCKPWQPMGWPWHTQRLALAPHGLTVAQTNAFFEEILGLWTRYFAHMLRKIKPSSLPSFTFFEKKNIFFLIFLIEKIGKFIKNRKWVVSGR